MQILLACSQVVQGRKVKLIFVNMMRLGDKTMLSGGILLGSICYWLRL